MSTGVSNYCVCIVLVLFLKKMLYKRNEFEWHNFEKAHAFYSGIFLFSFVFDDLISSLLGKLYLNCNRICCFLKQHPLKKCNAPKPKNSIFLTKKCQKVWFQFWHSLACEALSYMDLIYQRYQLDTVILHQILFGESHFKKNKNPVHIFSSFTSLVFLECTF